MAEKNVSELKDLLTKAVKAMEGLADTEEGDSKTERRTDSSSNQSSSSNYKTELERLFPNVYGKKRTSSTTTHRKFSSKKYRSTSLKKKEKTVTRKFVCLADKSQTDVPTVQEKRELFLGGLGEKKIALPVDGEFPRLHALLVDSFPRLSDAGGFELMYTEPGKRDLHLIPTGPQGNTVAYISQFIGQGRVYVRPIQCNIDITADQVHTDPTVFEEICNSCLQFVSMDKLREHMKDCLKKKKTCNICLQQVVDDGVSPACCNDVFHSACLNEWHKTSDGSGSKCPVCNELFFTIHPREVIDCPIRNQGHSTPPRTQSQSTTHESSRQHGEASDQLPRQLDNTSGPLASTSNSMSLKETDNTDLFYSSLFDDQITIEVDSDNEQTTDTFREVEVRSIAPHLSLQEILSDLARGISENKISKFNICRNDIWEGTKRGLTRKSFSPGNKISVRFSDDSGRSEGAVDLGGPTREFLTLVIDWLANSQLFCGPREAKFLSCNAACLDNSEYLYAGKITALSLVHGGPGLHFFSPCLYDALVNGVDKAQATVDDVYDPELKSSLQKLSQAQAVPDAYEMMSRNNLDTILELAGTLNRVKSIKDIDKIVQQTAHWYTLGRAWPALEQFKQGLSDMGVLEAITNNPNAFTVAFCHFPEELDALTFSGMFIVLYSEEGSNKRATENVILSYWHDYLQDAEDGETMVTLSDVLFFTSGLKQLPPMRLGWDLSLGFLHDPDNDNNLSPYPKANTCGPVLQLPIVHKSYDAFKDAMNFAIGNSKGFGFS